MLYVFSLSSSVFLSNHVQDVAHNKSMLHRLHRKSLVIDMIPNNDKSEVDIEISQLLFDKNTKQLCKYKIYEKYSIYFYFHFLAFESEFVGNNLYATIGAIIVFTILLLAFIACTGMLVMVINELRKKNCKIKKSHDEEESLTTQLNI